MAKSVEKTVDIIFQGKDEVSPTMDKISGNLKSSFSKFDQIAQSVASPLAGIGDKILKVDAALTALAVGGVAYSISKFADFQDVMLKVKGVMGANEEEYQKLTDLTKQLGAETRYTATEAAQGLEFLAMAGFNAGEAMGALPKVLNLAQAAAVDLGEATDIVTNIMSGYGIGVDGLGKANDVLTATFTNANTNLQELGQAFKFVGPVAKGMGLELEETASILGIFSQAGIKAEMGGTALRNILLTLAAPTTNAGKLFKKLGVDTAELGIDFADSASALVGLGVNVKDSAGNMRPFVDIMEQLKAGLDKLPDPMDRTAALAQIFGKRGGPQMAALLEQGVDAVSGLETKIRSLGGITDSIATQMESGMGGALRALRSGMESIALEIGERVSQDIDPATRGLTEVFRALSKEVGSGTFEPIFAAFGEFAQKAESLFLDIAKNLPAALEGINWDGVISAIKSLTGALGGIFEGIDLRTPDGLRNAIQGLVNGFEFLIRATKGIVDAFKPMVDFFSEAASRAVNMDAEMSESFGNIAGNAMLLVKAGTSLGAVLIAVYKAGVEMSAVFDVLGAAIDIAQAQINLLTAVITTLIAAFMKGLAAVTDFIPGLGNMSKALSDTADRMRSFRDTQLDAYLENCKDANRGLASAFLGTGESADSAGKRVRGFIETTQEVPGEIPTEIVFDEELAQAKYNEMVAKMSEESDAVNLDVKVDQDKAKKGVDAAFQYAVERTEDGVFFDIIAQPNVPSIDSSKKKIKDEIPDKREVEIQTKIKIEEIKEQAETIREQMRIEAQIDIEKAKIQAEALQNVLQFKAELDVSNLEANVEYAKGLFQVLGDTLNASADSLIAVFGNIAEIADTIGLTQLNYIIMKEMNMKEEALKLQKELTEEQIKNMQAQRDYLKEKTRRLAGNDALIKIVADGLQPELEAFMWRIIERVQIQAAADEAEFLLGIAA